MAEWVYKATATKVDEHRTGVLAHRGLICRSAYDDRADRSQRARHVADVAIGDLLHLYFRRPRGAMHGLGSYRICSPSDLASPAWVIGSVDGTALHRVAEGFVRSVDEAGEYEPDPVLGDLTGWLVKRESGAPTYDESWLPGRATLAKIQ